MIVFAGHVRTGIFEIASRVRLSGTVLSGWRTVLASIFAVEAKPLNSLKIEFVFNLRGDLNPVTFRIKS